MQQGRLPERIDPLKYAKAGRRLAGELDLAPMARLGGYLSRPGGTVYLELEFGFSERVPVIRGHLKASVVLKCQRCLEDFEYPLEGTVSLGVIEHESLADRLPEAFDPLVFGDEFTSLPGLVEDELILMIPVVAKHPESECKVRVSEVDGDDQREEGNEGGRKENPFAVLSGLKTSKKS